MVVDAAALQDRRQRLQGDLGEAPNRAGRLPHATEQLPRVPDRRHCQRADALDGVLGGPGHPADVVAQHRLDEPLGVEHHRFGCLRHRAQFGAFRGEVEQRQPELDGALAVGDGVVQLLNEHRLASGQAVEQEIAPQRPVLVEVGHALPTCDLQDVLPVRRLRHTEPPQVERQVEVRVDDHARGFQAGRALDHLRAQYRRQPGGPFVAIGEAVPVGAGVHHQDAQDRRPHDGVVGGHPPGCEVPAAHPPGFGDGLAAPQCLGRSLFGGDLFGGCLVGGRRGRRSFSSGRGLFGGSLFGWNLFSRSLFGGNLFGRSFLRGRLLGGGFVLLAVRHVSSY